MKSKKQIKNPAAVPLPKSDDQALEWLLPLVHAADSKALKKVEAVEFKRGWFSIGFLYPGLHPDSALDHGKQISNEVINHTEVRKIEPRLITPFYVESGWPVVLTPVAKEAWRRYEVKELKDNEFYCSDAVMAGLRHRNLELS